MEDLVGNMSQLSSLDQTASDLNSSFPLAFNRWINDEKIAEEDRSFPRSANVSEEQFQSYLTEFLFSPTGYVLQRDVVFEGELECSEPAPPIKMFTFGYSHPR